MTAKRLKKQLSASFRTILALILLSNVSFSQSNTAILRQKINQDLPSNNNKQITASNLRSVLTSSADAIDQIYETISLADRLGTYNAATGIYTVSETGVTGNIVSVPQFPKGKYFDVVIAGVNSIPVASTSWALGDKIISSATKWDRIPFGVAQKSIDGAKLADAAVSIKKTNFFAQGKNLFNVLDEENSLGYFISESTGIGSANAGYNTTHFISVTPGESYSLASGIAVGARMIWYDASKNFISGVSSSILTQVAPAGAAFLRASVATSLIWANLQIEKGAYRSQFEPFSPVLTNQAINSKSLDSEASLDYRNVSYTPGKNLFNLNGNVNLGRFLSNGILAVNASYNVTDYIPVVEGESYTGSYKHTWAWYNANKGYISQSLNTDTNKTQVAPAGAKYLRCTVTTGSWALFQLEKGTAETSKELFKLVIDKLNGVEVTAKRAETIPALLPLSVNNIRISPGKNLFNANDPDVAFGFFPRFDTGTLSASALYNATGFIPVVAGQSYTMSYKNQLAWYSASKTYLSGVSSSSSTSKTQVAPAGAAYVRLQVDINKWSNYMFNVGAIEEPYEQFGYYWDSIDGIPVYAVNVRESFTPPVVAPVISIPRGKELALYIENIYKNFESDAKGKSLISVPSITTTDLFTRDRGIKYKQTNSIFGNVAANIATYSKNYDLVNTVNFNINRVSETLNTAKTVSNIGDSFTDRESFTKGLLGSAAASGITFVGMRKSSDGTISPKINHEGRGGWGISAFHIHSTTTFTPFMQPQDPYKYYGNTSFWITSLTDDNDYIAGRMDAAIKARYNVTTGLLVSPAVNDVMYVNADSAFKRWDGSAWVVVSDLVFTFNYAKYRSLYGFPVVDILHILLGTNDFNGSYPNTFANNYAVYKSRMDITIASFKADNPSGKFIVGIPVSSGRQGKNGTMNSERLKLIFWTLAKNLIADYGNREAEGIYLSDYHSTVDRVNGFDPQPILPFEDYTGTERDQFVSDAVHLSTDGFKQMSNIYFGSIQSLR